MVDGLVVEVLGGDDLLDDLLLDLLAELVGTDLRSVLGGNNNGVYADRDDGAAVVLVLNSHLGLGVRPEPGQRAVVAGLLHGGVELVREEKSQREELRSLVSGITEHDTLVTSSELLESLLVVETLGNIGGLLLNGDKNVAGLVVEALVGVVVANVLDSVADDLLVVEAGLCGDLTKDHDHTGLGRGLASYLGEGVLSEACIEDCITDLVGDLVDN